MNFIRVLILDTFDQVPQLSEVSNLDALELEILVE